MNIKKCFLFILFIVIGSRLFGEELLAVRIDANYPPYEMVVDDELTGFHIDLVMEVAKQMNIDLKFRSVPWQRAINMVKDGDADVITYIGKTSEREEFLFYHTNNILSSSNYAFVILSSRSDEIKFTGDLNLLTKYKIGVQRGYSYGTEFDDADFLNKVDVSGVLQLTTMLRASRIDLAVIDEPEFFMQQNSGNWSYLKLIYPVITRNEFYIGFSKAKGHEQLSNKFADTMSAFKKTSAYQALLAKYKLNK